MSSRARLFPLCLACLLGACGSSPSLDAGTDATSAGPDAAEADADAGSPDASMPDASMPEAGPPDGGPPDTGPPDVMADAGPDPLADVQDWVAGALVQINPNGGWCWYQDPRTIADPGAGRLIVGSVADSSGFEGALRDADIDATSFDLATGDRHRTVLINLPTYGTVADDHNAAAFFLRPDGHVLAAYTGHNDPTRLTRYRVSVEPHDATAWGDEQSFDWGASQPGTSGNSTYTNLLYLADEGRLYNIVRETQRSPAIAYSDDHGSTWTYGGMLTLPDASHGYSNGYFNFASNGVDRIDFLAAEHHPRDYNTGIFHGYIRGGQSFDSFGNLVDPDIFDQDAPVVEDFTRVFTPAPEDGVGDESEHHRAWTVDIDYRAPNEPHLLFTTRYGVERWPSSSPNNAQYRGSADHRLFYARIEGGAWVAAEIASMGRQLYDVEQDYTGLAALHPSDPDRVFVSTRVDPRTSVPLDQWEIFAGRRTAAATWEWEPLTWASTVDNARPIAVSLGPTSHAVLWWRGRYEHQHVYDLALVGLVERGDSDAPASYAKLDAINTRLEGGDPLPAEVVTGDPVLDAWRFRDTGDGVVLEAARSGEGVAIPKLVATIPVAADGTYDVSILYWSAVEGADGGIRAGLSADALEAYRRRGSQQPTEADFAPGGPSLASGEARLYRAYLGRRALGVDAPAQVHIGALGASTWADGVALTRVE